MKLEKPCKIADRVAAHGYGEIWPPRYGTTREHRAVLSEQLGRPLLRHEYACHHCDVKSCVEPTHLYLGDARSNGLDAYARGLNGQSEESIRRSAELRRGSTRTEVQKRNMLEGRLAARDWPLGVYFSGARWFVRCNGKRTYFYTLLDAAAYSISLTNTRLRK